MPKEEIKQHRRPEKLSNAIVSLPMFTPVDEIWDAESYLRLHSISHKQDVNREV